MYEDNELMARVQAGDKGAYEKLVLKHRLKALAFANSFVCDLYAAEDIVQECFVKVYIHRATYRPSHAFNTYLFTIIRNSCIDYLRSRPASRSFPPEAVPELSDHTTPDEVLASRENTKLIYEVLNDLQIDYKTALYLYAVADFSYKDIARIMKKSVPQIKILLYRARKKFKLQYKELIVNEE
ncbi:RNA polymerase sigma factor [Paenibacillus graminis]|uniref:RNA polymerase sigma factor n=1 Tax=Paenibacillus graminis TaxID=189425 RepID=A0A089MGV9_9BACL|nr:RNA polymerase sigma factor [Paenibacillus graminis]AIQ70733.1 hypothetical protein PGRAT_26240 [Paenibacillus graminis]